MLHHEFGLDVVAWIGALRYREQRSVPEIHQALVGRGVAIAPRTVEYLLGRYDELLSLSLQDRTVLRTRLSDQGWQQLRAELATRQHPWVLGQRFRRDPEAYLHALEDTWLKSSLRA